MTKIRQPKILGIMIAAFAIGILFGSTSNMSASADEGVPDWFKGVAGFWSEDKISTGEFLDGVEFLLEQEIINVDGYGLISDAEGQIVEQNSLDEIWTSINSLQEQIDKTKGVSNSTGMVGLQTGSVTSEIIADGTIQFSDIAPSGCMDLQVLMMWDGEWRCGGNAGSEPETYIKMNTDRGTAVALCDSPSFVVGGGGIATSGRLLEKSFPLGTGELGVPNNFDMPVGWVVSTNNESVEVTSIVVCMKLES